MTRKVKIFTAILITLAIATGSVLSQETRSENPFATAIEKMERQENKAPPRSTPPPAETTLRCVAEDQQCSCTSGADSRDCRVMNAFLCVGEDRYKRMKCDVNGRCSCRTRPQRG